MNPYKDKDLRKFIEAIPQEEVDKQTRLEAKSAKLSICAFIKH
jgi:hypothetical protein